MLTAKHLPDAVMAAAIIERNNGGSTCDVILAALNAWPGATRVCESYGKWKQVSEENSWGTALILPLPKEGE